MTALRRRGAGNGLIGTAALALMAGAPVLAQDVGGVHLTFGVTERLEASENAALSIPPGGRVISSTTSLSFGLSSETQTQVFRLGVSGDLRFEGGALVERFDSPSLNAFYGLSGANSVLVLRADAQHSQLSSAVPSPDDPDPQGTGSRTTSSASAQLDFGIEGPLGLTVQARRGATDYSDAADGDDSETLSASATGYLRVSPVLSLEAELGKQRVETDSDGTSEGLMGHVSLKNDLANGSAGATLSQTVESGALRQNFRLERGLDLGNQSLALMLGATRLEGGSANAIGSVAWRYDMAGLGLSVDVGRSVSGATLGNEVTTDRLALGVTRDLSSIDRLSLGLSAARIDNPAENLIERADITASYSRDLGRDWQMTFGASLTRREVETDGSAMSRLLFLSVSRSFDIRP